MAKDVMSVIRKLLKVKKTDIEFTEDEQKLISLLHKNDGVCSIKELSSEMDKSSDGILTIAQSIKEKGILIWNEEGFGNLYLGGSLVELPPEDLPVKDNKIKIGLIADSYIGSKFQLNTALHQAFQIAEEEGVNFMIHLGVTAGKPTAAQKEEFFLQTAEEQAQYIIENYPKSDKFKTRLIGGFHDNKWQKEDKNVLATVCEERKDLVYRGDFQSDFPLRRGVEEGAKCPILRAIYHGGDTAPYAKSYGVQGVEENLIQDIDDLFKSTKPDIGVVAGQGVYLALPGESVRHLGSVPALRMIPPSILRKKNRVVAPTIGFVILTIRFDEDGSFSIKSACCPLNKVENDYKTKPSDDKEEFKKLSEDERSILKLLEASPKTAGEMSQSINKSTDTVSAIIASLCNHGYKIVESESSKNFKLKSLPKNKFTIKPINFKDYFYKTIKRGAVSDTHIGGKTDLLPIVQEAYDIFEKRGIKEVYHLGDVNNGPSKHNEHMKGEVYEDRATPLIELVREVYPKREGIITHMIAGNHDCWFNDLVGLDIVKHIAEQRPDIDYLGMCEGETKDGSVTTLMKHYDWGGNYARTYKPQAVIETLLKEVSKELSRFRGKNIIILSGGGHVYCSMILKGVMFILMPCLQGKTGFVNRMGKISDVGFLIYSITCSKSGELTKFSVEYFDRIAAARLLERKRSSNEKRRNASIKEKKAPKTKKIKKDKPVETEQEPKE
ncbi:MAG: hypothetical protein UT05_C0013G0003 [Parcubacteria group bacterium GW2011_GWF2_38_76]|nr:MAG: hypothetical protein UT05_C0013G0003 [Parcubacteria group bacterium GW2011_GWF2_38_76]HBM45405.1 hypothetical protein [Patescibacteria group bacterium]